MQELQELLINKIIKKENGHLNDLQEGFNDGLICALEFIEEALVKEKEQIKTAFASGWNWNSDPEKYYQETYNQEETLEEWKSKFTHHCAIKTNKNQ